jgi:hypothetical protein
MVSLNWIEPLPVDMPESSPDTSLLAMTLLVSFTAVGYGFFYLKNKLVTVEEGKQDADERFNLDKTVYQAWSGTFADGENSLIATIVKQRFCTRKENEEWVDWDGSHDSSVITRNFYLGNTKPSFEWELESRDFDTKATVKDIMIDGWDSLIQLKLTCYMKNSYETSEHMNAFLRKLIEENRIEWQKTVLDLAEYRGIFQ